MKYRACVFDLDGTLADTLKSIAYFGNSTLEKFNLSPIETEKYKLMVGNGADKLISRMLKSSNKSANFSEDKIHAMRHVYDKLYEANPMKFVTPYDGIADMLAKLQAKNFKLAVLSNKPDNMTKFIAESLFPNTFDIILGQTDNMPKKPNPTSSLSIISAFQIPASEILYIGDSGVDMQTGRAAGMDTAGVLWGFRDETELLENGAVYIAKTAEQLLQIALKLP
jgi:haloacid dehalogenase superfamily, subfamily IA, variant 1 with third motif having Dx(3-4)D or Dx(3-4)E